MRHEPAVPYEALLQALGANETATNASRHLHHAVADELAARHTTHSPVILGLAGSQGSGKSTHSKFLQALCSEKYGLSCCVLSIDDVYLSRAERHSLSTDIHPLLATRGVPGTHNIALAHATFDALSTADRTTSAIIPRFDKASDDPVPKVNWPRVLGPVDVIIFEGWCVGAQPQAERDLEEPINQLESSEDPDGLWRTYVNTALESDYAELFQRMDMLLMLAAPNFEVVFNWRKKQEDMLRAKTQGSDHPGIMNDAALRRFIMHYQRITEAMLDEMPTRADCVVRLSPKQEPLSVSWK